MQQNKIKNDVVELVQRDADGNDIRLPFVSLIEKGDFHGEFKAIETQKEILPVSAGKKRYLKSFCEFLRRRLKQRKRKPLPVMILASPSTKGGMGHE